jgi:hypothetical protein
VLSSDAIGNARRVDWQVRLTKFRASDFTFCLDAYTRRNDSIEARCPGITLLHRWSVLLVSSACHVR